MSARFDGRVTLAMNVGCMAADLECARQAVLDMVGSRPGLGRHEVLSVEVRPAVGALTDQNLISWQELEVVRLGTSVQRARWLDGCLDDKELTDLARPALFAAFTAFSRWSHMTAAAIGHPRGVDGAWTCATGEVVRDPVTGRRVAMAIPVDWSTRPTTDLTATEFVILAGIHDAVNVTNAHPWHVACSVETRIHKGVCQTCKREAAETSALVTIQWAGRTLSREYAL